MLPILHPQNVYKVRPINENSRSILLFALALYLLFCERKVLFEISYVHVTTFWFTHNYIQMKTMTSVKPDTTVSIHWPRPINFTTHAVTYYEHIPVCINQRYTSLNKTLFLYNSIIAFIISRGNNIIPILTIIKDLSE